MTTSEYLDLYKRALGLRSDYAIHKVWDCSRSYVSKLRCGEAFLTEAQAEEVAKAAGIPLTKVLADVAAERAKSPALRHAWKQIATLVSSTTIAGVVAFGVNVAQAVHGGLYIMLNTVWSRMG